jgi:hypothetical protein
MDWQAAGAHGCRGKVQAITLTASVPLDLYQTQEATQKNYINFFYLIFQVKRQRRSRRA